MNTSKIMRVLNAMYKFWKEQKGAAPISDDVYEERKRIINEQNKKGSI